MTSKLHFIDVPESPNVVRLKWKAFTNTVGSVRDEPYFIPASGRCFVALLPHEDEAVPHTHDPRSWFVLKRRGTTLQMFARYLEETSHGVG